MGIFQEQESFVKPQYPLGIIILYIVLGVPWQTSEPPLVWMMSVGVGLGKRQVFWDKAWWFWNVRML